MQVVDQVTHEELALTFGTALKHKNCVFILQYDFNFKWAIELYILLVLFLKPFIYQFF